jgi:hypothetical protein
MATTTEERNKELMQTLDDAWNAQDVDVFRQRHKPDVIVRWPGQPEPTVGIEDHTAESIAFWKTFPDQKLDNRPYKVFLADGDWTASIARFRGTMTGPMQGPSTAARSHRRASRSRSTSTQSRNGTTGRSSKRT